MMLKITKAQESESDVRLLLDGPLTHRWATLLDEMCRDYLQQHKVVELDCAHVDFVDAKGVAVLNDFPPQHVTLTRAPVFFKQLLRHGDRL